MIATSESEGLSPKYPDNFLTCRELHHSWERIGFYHADGEIVRALMCTRCRADRHDYWSPGGRILRRRYDYPEGYSLSTGGRISAWSVRQEVLSRVTVYDSPDAMHDALFGPKAKAKRGRV